ncbi:KEOPS complex subunit Pcc1 [Methanomethylovorans sp. PtaU1.Bin093]|uniref:KEOPS complex subunit Pcc1 n=1 Tax=Methanomethylovorans sp. PtaU1.Bin093 TaxID=1811679 RepID=UPI0025F1D49F|nr:KEOPS complex subunit Pcc1 [Methanomethylovorans sp. PtaU1.Bin093]
MEATAESVFETDRALLIYRSLMPEIGTTVTERSEISLQVLEDRLILKVIASDLVSLRSTMNTWLRLIQVAYEVLGHTSMELQSN